ncbi:MAG: undecaprenyl-diphosphate phosphatase [Cytophagales bacterium]|nr:MAG: undecaprenyl-diphosphate phosphatase [Cytophagales bacterium]
MSILQAILLAIVEGITEYLPISSTGHMIITSAVMGIEENQFVKVFIVNIQLGAILSVVVLYWKRFFQSFDFYFKLIIAVIPALLLGYLLDDYIDSLLGSVLTVAITLIVGGWVLIFIDRLFVQSDDTIEKEIPYLSAFWIGLFQCIAMLPGVSRSAASIIGGMTQKLSRKQAAEFSFFLAVPTMFAATAYKLLKTYKTIDTSQVEILLIGNLVAFVVAMLAIRLFIQFVSQYGFKIFGYYRIFLGIILLFLIFTGYLPS